MDWMIPTQNSKLIVSEFGMVFKSLTVVFTGKLTRKTDTNIFNF